MILPSTGFEKNIVSIITRNVTTAHLGISVAYFFMVFQIPFIKMIIPTTPHILAKMAKNGPVTQQMKKDVTDNIWHNSLVNWAKSF